MANQGVRGFYQLTETIKEELLKDVNVNTVTTGDITDVNLNKQDIFPLSHIIINSVVVNEQTLDFNISVLACDIVNQSKDLTLDRFKGNDNVQDILGDINNNIEAQGYMKEQYPNLKSYQDLPFDIKVMSSYSSEMPGFTIGMDLCPCSISNGRSIIPNASGTINGGCCKTANHQDIVIVLPICSLHLYR